ncbi:MAG: glycosyl hydrolase-related protein [candidate division KSB1 bacterium]|nr:glycosyl hydrolase-related protein [candidate division KSB1 bacterium]MDZ7304110.1 glycosyl hydrolase-related protein [candidate division KSB1 bacterium]MDZ7313393.1 glycosyl hydrolase-related protein [candidate division KSB1 bacterium]
MFSLLTPLFGSVNVRSQGYVEQWLVLGSFPARENNALTADLIGSETSLRPYGGLSTAGKIWRHYQTPVSSAGHAYLNFLNPVLDLSPIERAVAYAHVYVHSPRLDTLQLLAGFDEQLAVWVNGKFVFQRADRRAFRFDDDTLRVTLQKGWNSVLFKVVNHLGEWALAARFIGGENLIIQAETPERLIMIPRPDPEQIRLRPLELADDLVFSQDNVPILTLQTVISNPQQQSLGDCQARFFAPAGATPRSSRTRRAFSANRLEARRGLQIDREQNFELHAGELRPMNFRVPISTIVSGFQATGSWQIRLQFGKYEVRRVVPLRYDSRLLGRIFGTYEVEGIDTLAGSGALEFHRVIFLPKEWTGFPVFLSADIGQAEGTIWINDRELRYKFRGESGDLLLTDNAAAGARFEVRIHSTRLDTTQKAPIWPRLFLTVEHLDLRHYLMTAALLQQYHHGERVAEQEEFEEKMWAAMKEGNTVLLNQTIAAARSNLPKLPEAAAKLPDVTLVGTSHIDISWLWRYPETIDLCHATFAQAIRNIEKYPDFYFSHDQAMAYWWMEQDDPALFESIQKAVRDGRWEIVGGTWVESDLNMPSGESLARQFLYGKRYFKEKFGVDVKTGWMPAAFGHPRSLPQILKKSGMSSYLFFRPWETMRLFEWEGPDGSCVLSYRPPDWFNSRLTKEVRRHSYQAKKEFNWPHALRLFGIGDQSGGPTGYDIRMAEDLAYRPTTPTVRMARAEGFFQELIKHPPALSIHRDEINSVFPGAWTSQALHKWNNRRSEMLLPAAEAFSLLAQPYGMTYAHVDFTTQWRHVLFNQFYSILAGAGVATNYEHSQRLYRETLETAKAALDKSMTRIETAINSLSKNPNEIPVVVYNALSWSRTDVVEVEVTVPFEQQTAKSKEQKAKAKSQKKRNRDLGEAPEVRLTPYFRDAGGKKLLMQILQQDSTAQGMHYRLLFLPEEVPAFGYKVYWLEWSTAEPTLATRARVDVDSLTMSNSYYSIKIDSASGGLQHLVDSQQNREWMATKPGGLEILGERGGEMSALNIDYDGTREHLHLAEHPQVLETGPLRARLLTRYQYGNSQITQEYVIYATLPRVEMRYHVNWLERNKTLKVVYPFQLFDGRATAEIPFAAIERPTNGQEFSMQKWMDLSNEQFGVTLVNDSKYGADVQDGVVRMTALRSPDAPDPKADEGEHHFTFAITPHSGDWRSGAVQNGYSFNLPLIARVIQQQNGTLPPVHSFLSIEPARVIVSALKKAEDGDAWILRIYESTGQSATATISLPFAAKTASEVNLLEWEEKPLPLTGQKLTLNLGAWEVKTLKINQ